MGDDLVRFGGKWNHGTPPARSHANVADSEEPGDRDKRNKKNGSGPAQTLLHRLATFHPLFADVRGECGPSIVSGINRQAGLRGGPQKAVCPVAGIQANGPGISANDAFAEDSAGELLVAVLFQRKKVSLADLGYSSDLLQRDTARNPLRSKLLPKSTHLVTNCENHSLRYFHRQVTYGSARWIYFITLSYHRARGSLCVFHHHYLCKTQAQMAFASLAGAVQGLITLALSGAANLEN